jgi:hypothetical protein
LRISSNRSWQEKFNAYEWLESGVWK